MQNVVILEAVLFGEVEAMQDNKWKYKVDLVSDDLFFDIEAQYDITFPKELKVFIINTNGATPEKYKIQIGNKERVYAATLSFNKNEKEPDVDKAESIIPTFSKTNLIPFGKDPFGNYFCYDLKTNTVVFFDNECEETTQSNKTINEFIDNFY